MLILYKHFRVLKSFSSVQRVLRPQSWRNSTMNGAYVNLDGQATQRLWAVMSLICLNTVMFVRMLLSILRFRHHLHLYPVQAAFAEMLCPGSVMTLSVCLQPSEVQSAGGKPRVERSETFFWPCSPSFSFTPLLSCCSVAALPVMAPASHIYWKADTQLKWPACLKVSDLQWDSKDDKNVNQLRIFMFDTCCYDN